MFRSADSHATVAPLLCMSRQKAQWLICAARSSTEQGRIDAMARGRVKTNHYLAILRGELYPVQMRHMFQAEHLAVLHFVHCHVRDTMCPVGLALGHFP